MPRELRLELQALIASGHCNWHTTLDLTLTGGQLLFLSTGEIYINRFGKDQQYLAKLNPPEALLMSQDVEVDMLPFTVGNVDMVLGRTLTGAQRKLDGAEGIVGVVFIPRVAGSGLGENVALAVNGGVATASSTLSGNYPPSSTINGDRKGVNWGSGGGWNDATHTTYPDWLEITFDNTYQIVEIDVFSLQDNFSSPIEPTLTTTFTLYGITNFVVQYWTGSAWTAVIGGTVTGNNKVWRKFTFAAIATSKIRVYVTATAGAGQYSRIVEVEAYAESQTGEISIEQGIWDAKMPGELVAGEVKDEVVDFTLVSSIDSIIVSGRSIASEFQWRESVSHVPTTNPNDLPSIPQPPGERGGRYGDHGPDFL